LAACAECSTPIVSTIWLFQSGIVLTSVDWIFSDIAVSQEDGRNKRREAEAELTQIETTMRNKLMEMSRTKSAIFLNLQHFIQRGDQGFIRLL